MAPLKEDPYWSETLYNKEVNGPSIHHCNSSHFLSFFTFWTTYLPPSIAVRPLFLVDNFIYGSSFFNFLFLVFAKEQKNPLKGRKAGRWAQTKRPSQKDTTAHERIKSRKKQRKQKEIQWQKNQPNRNLCISGSYSTWEMGVKIYSNVMYGLLRNMAYGNFQERSLLLHRKRDRLW